MEPHEARQTQHHPGHIHPHNLLDDGAYAYTWDGAGRLIEVAPKSPSTGDKMVIYEYDYMSRRKRRLVINYNGSAWETGSPDSDTIYVNHSMQCLEELDNLNSDLPVRAYAWGQDVAGRLDLADSPFVSMAGAGGVGGLLCMVTAESGKVGTYQMTYDGNGNIVKLLNASGSQMVLYRYGPFGEDLLNVPHYVYNPFRFSTKFNETAMDGNNDGPPELYDYGFRWYHADLGRWTARDPIGAAGGFNLYAYVRNSSTSAIDLHGLKPLIDLLSERMLYLYNNHADQCGSECPNPPPGCKVTNCITYCCQVIEWAYEQRGDIHTANEINRIMQDHDQSGTELAKYLVKNKKWKAVYWNPDVKRPYDGDSEHPHSHDIVQTKRTYYEIPVIGEVINFRPTEVWQWVMAPCTDQSCPMIQILDRKKMTALDTTGLDKIEKVSFGFGVARGGRHTFLYGSGSVYEVHWDGCGTSGDLYEKTAFKDYEWLSGVIVVPPGNGEY